ncbi:unnamed protein product [Paramecium pentaurelia]|uniref:Uncharacterized protein n=1 Tax=Paramecium pentaurelia TaxID=43138 RepID=A0A8S1UAQ6_9CILI|nr:unnamed protein product [Paramecium pentaurelia]
MWKQFKNVILDQRVAYKYKEIQNAKQFISNSIEFNSNIKYDINIISKFSYIQARATQSKYPILIIGKTCPIKNSFNLFEYTTIYPQLLGLHHNKQHNEIIVAKQSLLEKGININQLNDEPQQISGIYVVGLERNWEIQAQVICDLLSTENGIINDKFHKVDQHIPLKYFYNIGDKNMENQQLAIESTYKLIYDQDVKMSRVISDFDILIDFAKSINDIILYINEDSNFIVNDKKIQKI